MLQGVGVEDMKSGPQPVIGVIDTMQRPGQYILEIPCPKTRTTAAVRIEMFDKHMLQYVDEFSVSFHMQFYKLFKWLIAVPLVVMCWVVLLLENRPVAVESQFELPFYHKS